MPWKMLTPFAKDIWTDTRNATFFGVECGSRMTVVRLRSGGLFVHSPVALDEETQRQVRALGEVRAVVAPSLFHHLYVAQWMAAFPSALYAACPGLDWKRADLPWNVVLGDQPHPIWAGEIEQVYFSARRENEIDFYVPDQKVMICADALLNISTLPAKSARLAAKLMGNHAPGVGWMEYLMVRDRRLARRQVDRILAWDFDRIVLSHGSMIDRDGQSVVQRAYAWL